MRRSAVAVVVALVLPFVAGTAQGSALSIQAWAAKLGTAGYNGAATFRVVPSGSSSTSQLSISVKHLAPSTSYAVTLRKGTCSTTGTLLASLVAITTSSSGTASRTSTLSATQGRLTRGAFLAGPVAIRVGPKCAVFGLVVSTVPAAPTGVTVSSSSQQAPCPPHDWMGQAASGVTCVELTLTWKPVPGATGYRVYGTYLDMQSMACTLGASARPLLSLPSSATSSSKSGQVWQP